MAKVTLCGDLPFWERLKRAFLGQGPQAWIRWLVWIVCLVILYQQVIDCCRKIRNPPITTHSSLSLNDSMHYPALTVCREPPYNKRMFPKFNFSTEHIGSILYSSLWKYFPYDLYNISDFWDEAVYADDVFSSRSLDQKELEGAETSSSIHLQSGMCHTIRPSFSVREVGRKSGYSLLLNHDLYDYKPLVDEEPGWKIYVHEPREKFSENINFMPSRQDHVFVPVGETTEVNVDAYQFNILSNCSNEENYSVTECEENCSAREDVEPFVNCTGPWLPALQKPLCNESVGMRLLVKATNAMTNKNCCVKNCRTTHYKTFVVKRTPSPPERNLTSNAVIYFSSKAVITMEERYSYTWSDFLGEVGGTVGFLVGLSIVGVIGIIENCLRFLFSPKEKPAHESDKDTENAPAHKCNTCPTPPPVKAS